MNLHGREYSEPELRAYIKELEKLLRSAMHDVRRLSKSCIGIQCDACPHISTLDGCVWQYAEYAMKLIGEEE